MTRSDSQPMRNVSVAGFVAGGASDACTQIVPEGLRAGLPNRYGGRNTATCGHSYSDDAEPQFAIMGAVPSSLPGKKDRLQSIRCAKQCLKQGLGLRVALAAERHRLGLANRIGDQAGTTAEAAKLLCVSA
jgi:hypothetical protein